GAPAAVRSLAVSPTPPIPWTAVAWWAVIAAWALGAAVVAGGHLLGFVRLRRLTSQASDPSPQLLRYVNEMAARLAIHPPRVRIVPGLVAPLVAGFVRPVLLWPAELREQLPEDGVKAVLVHELAHLRRRDHW